MACRTLIFFVKGNVVHWTNKDGKANPFWQDNTVEDDLDAKILAADLFGAPWADQIEPDSDRTDV